MQVTQALRQAVQQQARRIGTVSGARRRDWAEIGDRVARAAGGLTALGVEEGDRVAVLSLNSDDYLELLFSVAWSGGVVVPLNTRWSQDELTYALADCEPKVVVVDGTFEAVVDALLAASGITARVVSITPTSDVDAPAGNGCRSYEGLIASHDPIESSARGGDDLYGIFYTGGTTAQAKGVMLSHDNLMAVSLLWVATLHFDEATRYLHAAQLFHMAGAAPAIALTLVGGTHVVLPKFDPGAVLAVVAAERVNYGLFVPTMLNLLLSHPGFADADLSSLERIEYGASPMPVALLRRALEGLPGVRFIQGYGCSEATALVSALPERYHDLSGGESEKLGSAGRAVAGVEIRILDDTGREVPRGTVGEICVQGPVVMLGYWGQPDLTAQAFHRDWLRTGDGAWMDDDGFIFIVDRIKDMILTGGENVFSGEVEQIIYALQAVSECAVIGIPDPLWGESVHAVVVPRAGMSLTAEQVVGHCRERIAHYKCPSSVEIRTEPLPTSGAGKLLKHVLRAPYWAERQDAVG